MNAALEASCLVVAKAPVVGEVKTRLGAETGMALAAELAAAALLDTLAACTAAFGTRFLALAGDLAGAVRGEEISAALAGWTVFDQVGASFADRLVHAHHEVALRYGGPVVQVGMDTPQVTPELLRGVASQVQGHRNRVVLGPAQDGGWWVLGLADGKDAVALSDVAMSRSDTCAETVAAFHRYGIPEVHRAGVLRDVDSVADAVAVSAAAPATGFARLWASSRVVL